MRNVYYDGSLGAYVVTIQGTDYKLLALNMEDAIAEAVAMYNFIGKSL